MIAFWPLKNLSLKEIAERISEMKLGRNLGEIIRAVYKNRSQSKQFRSRHADMVFSSMLALSENKLEVIEEEIIKRNRPPILGQKVGYEEIIWSSISTIVFQLNPIVSNTFSKRVMESCLIRPTDLAYALIHSEPIALLAEHHQAFLNSSLLEIVISATDDSRSIYALKIARSFPVWSEISQFVFEAMIRGSAPKQVEAMWLVNQRSNIEEVISFMEDKGFETSFSVKRPSDIRVLTREIVNKSRDIPKGEMSYAIKMGGDFLSPADQEKLSILIRELLKNGESPGKES